MRRLARGPVCLVMLACVLASGVPVAHVGRAQGTVSEAFTLALGGDVIFDAPIEYVLRTRGLSAEDAASYDELFSDLRAPLSAADLAIVNLETPVGPRVRERSDDRDYPTFAAPPAFLDALARTGVDVVTVANNHAYDQGVTGLATTIEHARSRRLTVSGTDAADGYSVSRVRGARIAVVSLTQGTNHRIEHREPASPRVHFFDEARLRALVAHARAHADVVIVALHFTDTGDHMPTSGMRRWGRRAAEAGADLVVGHGPHVPASSEWLEVEGRRVLVLHSLGNLVAAMQAEAHAERSRDVHVRDSVVVSVRVSVRAGRVTLEPPTVAAYWIDDARSPSGEAPFTRPVAIDARSDGPLASRARRLAALFEATSVEPLGSRTTPPATPPATTASRATAPAGAPVVAGATTPAARSSTSAPTVLSGTSTRAPGESLGVVFRCGSAMEVSVDRTALETWVALMRDDRRVRLELTSTRCEGETPGLAERRARRASGLLATRGPSRSRFTWRAVDAVTETPRITAARH